MHTINWTKVGEPYTSDPANRAQLTDLFDKLDWKSVPPNSTDISWAAAELAKTAIREFNLTAVTHVAESPACAPFNLVALRARFKQGPVELFLLDEGHQTTPLATRLKAEAPNKP